MLHCGWPSTYSEHCIAIDETGGGADDGAGVTEDGGADTLAGADAGADEQSADANGIGTVSVAPASVIRVVVHPQVGIGAPE